MLSQMTSREVSEWAAYYRIKEEHEKADEKAAKASARAKENNR